MTDETIDALRGYDLRIIQPRHGYRFSLDPLLLCEFAGIRAGEKAIDLGTGSGIIPLVLARQCPDCEIVGVEFQEGMAELATRNVHLNGLAERIKIIGVDILSLRKGFPVSSFDLVVANPPYRKAGTGRISPRAGRDLARHESTAGLADFIAVAKYLVRQTGRVCLIYHTGRLAECLAEADRQRLTPVRLRFIHGSQDTAARMFLVELVKGKKGETTVLPPCFVADGNSAGKADMTASQGGEKCRRKS